MLRCGIPDGRRIGGHELESGANPAPHFFDERVARTPAMLEFKPDYEEARRRMDAWWECGVIDRALTSITFRKPESECVPEPVGSHGTLRDRWLDTDFNVRLRFAQAANTVYYADALPVKYANLGPDVFATFYGCELEFGERTSWSVPCLSDWRPESVDALRLDRDGFYFRKLIEMTDALIEVARGKFIVGHPDYHAGADCIAALRDPAVLCLDMIEHPEEVKALGDRLTEEVLGLYELFHEKFAAAGMPDSSWISATCDGRYFIEQCDFSCMVSNEMFEEFFLPNIERECAHMDRVIYHLDGPGALRYLDRLLEMPGIHAIQWVPGAGRDGWRRWVDVYRRIQQAGKGFPVGVHVSDLDDLFECLRPEGTWLNVGGLETRREADAALKKIATWT